MRVAVFAALVLALSCVGFVHAEDGADAAKPDGGAAAKEEGRGPRGEGRGPRGRFGRGEGGRGGFDREALRAKFDKDGDGKLSEDERAEMRKGFEGRRGGRPDGEGTEARGPRGRGGPGREEMLKKFDKDGDGKLSEEERTALRDEMKKRFEERGGEGRPEGGRRGGPRGRRPMPPAAE